MSRAARPRPGGIPDRGYGELDADPIGETSQERWCEIQTRGFRASSGDDVTDLVVALQIRRLLGDDLEHPARAALAREIDETLGDVPQAARDADRITEICDSLAFDYCSNEPEQLVIDPWPLAVPELFAVVGGFAADGYPQRLEPVVGIVRICAS